MFPCCTHCSSPGIVTLPLISICRHDHLCDLDFELAACFDTTIHYVSWLCKSVWQCHWVIKRWLGQKHRYNSKTFLLRNPSSSWIRNRVPLFTGGSALGKMNRWHRVNPQWVTTAFFSFRTKSQRETWLAGCWHRWIHTHLGSSILSGIRESNFRPQPLTWSNHRWPDIFYRGL